MRTKVKTFPSNFIGYRENENCVVFIDDSLIVLYKNWIVDVVLVYTQEYLNRYSSIESTAYEIINEYNFEFVALNIVTKHCKNFVKSKFPHIEI